MATINSSKVPIGTVLEGKFRITREIGRGGMATVYDAENVDIGKRVAVKILAAELITSRVVRERFIREARASAAIRSPYICDVYDSGMYDERPFLVMELLEGESLYDMMTRVRQIDIATTLRIAIHSARGLAKAHESNVVHRDLKPENIFLTKDEEGDLLAKILDFGLAKFYEPTGTDAPTVRLTREGALFGTPAYMSPEQAKGQGEVDSRADLWALGCIVYECLTGQTVWNVEQGVAMILAQIATAPLPRPSKLRPDLPASFDRWFERALDRDPTKRYQTAREFSDSLAEALSPKQAGARALARPAAQGELKELLVVDTGSQNDGSSPFESATGSVAARDGAESPAPVFREPALLSTEPPPIKSSSVRAISALMVVSALALGGYAAWLYVLHPPGKSDKPLSTVATRPTAGSVKKRAPRPEPTMTEVEREPYAEKIAAAQELLRMDPKGAIEAFRAAFQDGSMPAARSLLSHANVAVEEAGACRLTGIAHPRPFQLDQPVSRPNVAHTAKGTVISWVDNHADPRRRQTFTVLLDAAMRRISMPISVTPEAHNVRQHELVPAGERIALLYWEEGGKEPGVYARLLDAEGKIETRITRLSGNREGDPYPALARAENGEFWAAWEEEFENKATDVVLRRLGPDLEPKQPAVRVTALRPPSGPARQPRTLDLNLANGRIELTFAKDLGSQRVQVLLQSIAVDDPALATGVEKKPAKAPSKQKKDEALGTLRAVSSPSGRNPLPRLACTDQGCFVAWDDEKAGALTAFVDHARGPLWHREFADKGARPSLGQDARGVAVAWYEGARLKLAPLTRDGVGTASVVSRVNGLQPFADLAAGNKPGEWYLAFRDYESAHLEIFALRAECP